jgi:hypothetical protein
MNVDKTISDSIRGSELPELAFRADLLALNAALAVATDTEGGPLFLEAARHLRQFAGAATPEVPVRRTAPLPFRTAPPGPPR